MKVLLILLGLVFLTQAVKMGSSSQLLRPPNDKSNPILLQQGDVTFTSFGIRAPAGADAVMKFTDGEERAVVLALLSETGTFVIKNERYNIMEIEQNGHIILGVSKLQIKSLQFYGDLVYQDRPQWKLFINENFWTEPQGWDSNAITTCGGVHLLGGYCVSSTKENSKTFRDLPPHKKVRITATFHFIDAWTGESGYLKADIGRDKALEYIWTDNYDHTLTKKAINICGAKYGEGKFASPIDVVIPHIDDTLTLAFGSTLELDPCEESWGISNLSIYVM
jgi:hypothetical protein